MTISALLKVDDAGLVTTLGKQLGYVPRYAMLEWYLVNETQQFAYRSSVLPLGAIGQQETFGDSVVQMVTLAGHPLPTHIIDAFKNQTELTRIWCHSTLMAMRQRRMLLEVRQSDDTWSVRTLSMGYHGIQ